MSARRLLPLLLGVLAMLLLPAPAVAAPASALPGTLKIQMVPPIKGVVVTVDGNTARSDRQGRLSVRVRNFTGLDQRFTVVPTAVSPDRRVLLDRFRGSLDHGVHSRTVEVGLRTVRRVWWRYADRDGAPVPVERVTEMRLRSNTGEVIELAGADLARPLWVAESRTQQGPRGLASKQLYYVVDRVMVDGTSVVNRAGHKFVPWERQNWLIELLFFKVSFSASDMFFTRRAGDGIQLTRADGRVQRLPFAADGTALVPDLPRGTYTVTVLGGGVSFGRPVSISRDQQVMLSVISAVDLTLVALGVLGVAVGLVLVGRPALRRRLRALLPRRERPTGQQVGRWRRPLRVGLGCVVVVLLLASIGVLAARPARAAGEPVPTTPAADPTPVLAHYYIWFNPTSWNRAKTDYPQLGRYSSDDTEIMRRHVRMAKAAGLTGFLVSWKHTPQLDDRLASLVEVARAEDFRLGIVYQGLDFSRKPLPRATVRADLELFADRYAADEVFDVFDKPVVIWNGSDRFTAAEVADTVRAARQRLLVLGAAKSPQEVATYGSALDGQAYYWSSADALDGRTRDRLAAMSQAVHLHGGLWIAPVAPGFDARQLGGRRVVARRDGETLRASFAAARLSQPDALGVISWNEFSENTHVEPSERFGARYLEVLAELLGASVDHDVAMDSQQAYDDHWGLPAWGAIVASGGALALVPLWVFLRRRRSPEGAVPPAQRGADHDAEAPVDS
ncbi:hypothetical protein MCAG_00295 [Micromonospora sp. ATCC 39149]|uniref:Glycosyl hydrolase family 99 n=1 Tax=Micromonospora carbonacea TaxID=47853 RepID=A0A7D5YA94_9ACTN|nr:hypothetical protein [Micromonospora sp. ATCC 39149]EEP69968.1 hypothetical protein MCAG_00295 [Micromonospora sp. ATCC 39149]QLJ96417.1 hypothetical protein HZU44_15705 [Micromonospora carbonacea]